jgi:hypothetical protein
VKPHQPASRTAILALLWFSFFVISLAIPLALLLRASIETPTVLPAIEQISSLYAPHLGAVLAFYFATKPKPGRKPRVNSGPFVAAILVSLVWNVVVAGALLVVPFGKMSIDDALTFVGGAAPKLSWLVAPALGFFFAKPGESS